MKRKNSTVKRKVKRKSPKRDLKIKRFYINFKKIIFKNLKKERFAIAVSGGSDSLCLAYLSKMYSAEYRNKMDVLIVDHKLRSESSKEAVKVKSILKTKKIEAKILSWAGTIPKKNIQNSARNIRYSLISNYCSKKNIKFLITAHHMDDQVENFFIRLFRGSGLTGLSSMQVSSKYSEKLKIIRPFLALKKIDLKYVTLKFFKTYIQDPSNENEKYLRIRIRKNRKKLEGEGLNTNKIIKTVANLVSANEALIYYKKKSLQKHVSFLSKDECAVSEKIFIEEADEIIFKSFSDILSLVSGTYYPPRSKKVISLINRLKKSNYSKSTLGGCVIEKNNNFILISKEAKKRKIAYQVRK